MPEAIKIIISVDGNMYIAHYGDFENLQESPAGCGETVGLAVMDLLGCSPDIAKKKARP